MVILESRIIVLVYMPYIIIPHPTQAHTAITNKNTNSKDDDDDTNDNHNNNNHIDDGDDDDDELIN